MGDTKLTLASLQPRANDMSSVLSLYNLLSQASHLPCSSGAAAFLSIVPSENERFPLALDVLLPTLQGQSVQAPQRILAAFVLHVLYASHDHLNPFHDHLLEVFQSERTAAIALSRTNQLAVSPEILRPSQSDISGLRGKSEQFIWVLWKILRGEGKDLAPYSPDILARTALPEHLRPYQLALQNTQAMRPQVIDNDVHPTLSRDSPSAHQLTTASYQTRSQHFQQETLSPTTFSPTDPLTQHFPFALNRTQTRSKFSPFESENESNNPGTAWNRQESLNDFYPDQQQRQLGFESPLRQDTKPIRTRSDFQPTQESSSAYLTKNRPSDNLLHAVYAESLRANNFQTDSETEQPVYLQNGQMGGSDILEDSFDVRRGVVPGNESNYGLRSQSMHKLPHQNSLTPPSASSRVQPHVQFFTAQNNELGARERYPDVSAPFSSTTATAPLEQNVLSRPQLGPIARPKPTPSLFYNSSLHEGAVTVSANNPNPQSTPQVTRTSQIQGLLQTQETTPNGLFQTSQPSPTRISPTSMRNPGVIGSGRPSSKPISPAGSDESERKSRPIVGVIGNGRPTRYSPGLTTDVVDKGTAGTVQPTEQEREREKKNFGAIGRPNTNMREVGELSIEQGMNGLKLSPTHEESSSVDSVHTFAWQSILGGHRPVNMSNSFPEAQRQAHSTSVLRAGDVYSPISSTPSPDPPNSASSSPQNYPPLPPSTSPSLVSENTQARQQSENLQGLQTHTLDANVDARTEKERDELSRAILLLLSARERVLTLSEQRALAPHLPMLTCPLSLLRPRDIPSLVSKNPDVAVKLVVLLLDRDDEEGARVERVLRDITKNDLFPLGSAQEPVNAASLSSFGTVDAVRNVVDFVAGVGDLSLNPGAQDKVSPFGGREAREGYLEALRGLPPTMQSFNLVARLLHPTPPIAAAGPSDIHDTPEVRVAKLVKTEVLGGLLSGCVHWIEKAERDGEVLDDRVAVSVSSLSRFYTSLLKHGFVSAESEVDTTEIMSFALQFSRFEEARSLYSRLAAARV